MGVRLKGDFERDRGCREKRAEKEKKRALGVAIEATAYRFAQRATERNEFREREANNRLKWQARRMAGGGGRGMRSTQRVMPKAVAVIFIVILGIVILL